MCPTVKAGRGECYSKLLVLGAHASALPSEIMNHGCAYRGLDSENKLRQKVFSRCGIHDDHVKPVVFTPDS